MNEVDGDFVPGFSSSVGSFIRTLASNSQIFDRKSRYFVTLGMKGILGMTDTTLGSQLSQLPEEALQAFQNKFAPGQKNCIKYSRTLDQDDIVPDVYQHILKPHLCSTEVFSEKARSFLSEQGYIVKVWSYLIKITFRTSGVVAHWGDTISSFSIENEVLAKMDLRCFNRKIKKN
ncbi:hypothetical protein G6F36_013681 [Rhizopus arrhizus]|nr:hypothetical protein G6F36_013681 [Rhizopus arrhizus]